MLRIACFHICRPLLVGVSGVNGMSVVVGDTGEAGEPGRAGVGAEMVSSGGPDREFRPRPGIVSSCEGRGKWE